ncbi:MAG: ComEC/Rec2 family competence protein, partial [Candidatus Krumholzibacteriaceae bacterium]
SRTVAVRAGAGPRGGGDAVGIRSLALTGARSRLLDLLDDGRLSKRSRALVGALILDDRRGLDFRLTEAYSYVGITHLLALSGMHLAAIAIPLSKILPRLIRSKRAADAALLAVLCLYSAVAGFPPSLLRSLFLCAAVIGNRFLGAHVDLAGSLIAGCFVLAGLDSSVVFDAGFQLSFAAVCGIAFIAIPVTRAVERVMPPGVRGTIARAVLFPALLTCSVQFLTLPLTISLFKRSSLLSPLVNVLVSFPFTILLYAGVLYVFVPLGAIRAILAPPVNLLCRFLAAVPSAFSHRPHAALIRGDFSFDIYFLGAALVVLSLRKSCGRKRLALGAGVACVALAFLWPVARCRLGGPPGGERAGNAATAAVPVGCEGCLYLPAGEGVVFVGEKFSSGDSYRMVRLLWGDGVRRIGCCVVTPSRPRATNGLAYLLSRISVREIVCSPYLMAGKPALARDIGERGLRVRAVSRGDLVTGGPWRLEILGPVYPPPRGAPVSRSEADLSWRFVLGDAWSITSLDLGRGSGYYAVP